MCGSFFSSVGNITFLTRYIHNHQDLIVIVATISSEFSSEFYIIGVLIGVLIVIDVFMDSHRSSILGTKRRVRGRNVETVLQRSNYDENQGANRRVRGKNVSNVLSSADSTNNKENYSPNVASVSTNLRRLPQSILHDPAILSSGHVGKNITGKNVSKCRVRGKNVDNIMSNVSKQAYSRPPLTTIDQNSQSPFVSQSSGSSISSKSHMTPRTTFHSRMETINLSGDMQRNQTNNNHKNTCESGQSTLTFSMPASTLKPINKRRPDYKKQHPHDETEQHVAKKRCGKMSPIPFSVGKDGVRSSFEVGETSGPINLMSDFNNVEDTFSSESDSLEQGDYEDLDDEEIFYTQQDSWNGYMDIGAPDKLCGKYPLRLWEAHWRCMSDDIILLRRHLLDDHTLFLSDDDVQKYALAEIEKLLNDIGKSLRDFSTMPFPGNTEEQNKIIAEFSKWQLAVGDGRVEHVTTQSDVGEMLIKIPDQYVVHTSEDPIRTLFDVTYPDFSNNMSSHSYLRSRAILTPTNIVVDDINNQILDKIPGTLHTYLSQDSIDDAGDEDSIDDAGTYVLTIIMKIII
ncbi:hypothetical protein POM88_053407 [Heracleum sosnowskyi]|uniref:DNA helicase n=1 Tax=Heracleum sosnowskyi TaxID=360622 RepID=A0AAD8GQW5_9APIA|nr:hypothetical protein POM88_053407 [Heracleum sosnowskyi]